MAACHSFASCSAFGSFVMNSPASFNVISVRARPRLPLGGTGYYVRKPSELKMRMVLTEP
jgi:hypothetical protein